MEQLDFDRAQLLQGDITQLELLYDNLKAFEVNNFFKCNGIYGDDAERLQKKLKKEVKRMIKEKKALFKEI